MGKVKLPRKKHYDAPKLIVHGNAGKITKAFGDYPDVKDVDYKGQTFWGSEPATE